MPLIDDLPSNSVNDNTTLVGNDETGGVKTTSKFAISSIANYILSLFNNSSLTTTSKNIVGSINEIKSGQSAYISGFALEGTIEAGNTEIIFEDERILATSTGIWCTSVFGVNPTDVDISAGSITLTFDERDSDLGVRVVIL